MIWAGSTLQGEETESLRRPHGGPTAPKRKASPKHSIAGVRPETRRDADTTLPAGLLRPLRPLLCRAPRGRWPPQSDVPSVPRAMNATSLGGRSQTRALGPDLENAVSHPSPGTSQTRTHTRESELGGPDGRATRGTPCGRAFSWRPRPRVCPTRRAQNRPWDPELRRAHGWEHPGRAARRTPDGPGHTFGRDTHQPERLVSRGPHSRSSGR